MHPVRSTSRLALVAGTLLLLGGLTAADSPGRGVPGFQILVNPANRIDSIDRAFLSDVYLKKVATWHNDWTVRPVQLSRRFGVRDQFNKDVIKKSPAQLRSYWNRQIFAGKGVPPPELESEDDVIRYVLANKGAIGYVTAGVDPRGARVVRIK